MNDMVQIALAVGVASVGALVIFFWLTLLVKAFDWIVDRMGL